MAHEADASGDNDVSEHTEGGVNNFIIKITQILFQVFYQNQTFGHLIGIWPLLILTDDHFTFKTKI